MEILFIVLIGVMAFLYASVGHGGASGYLAVMAIYAVPAAIMKPTSLALNVFVSLLSFIAYYRSGHFIWKKFLPFALGSIPCSYIGGMMKIDDRLYKIILGCVLVIGVLRLLVKVEKKGDAPINFVLGVIVGGLIGFLSGLLGIGGGIILSPLILLLGWADIKQTAAISALFIFVNSVAGLMGQLKQGMTWSDNMYGMLASAIVGGTLGAHYGTQKFDKDTLRYILAIVLLIASIKLIFAI